MNLGDIVDIISGHPFRAKIQHNAVGANAVVQMKDLLGRGIDWSQVVCADVKSVKSERLLKAGDILFVARGDRHRAVFIDQAPAYTLCSPHFFILRTSSAKHAAKHTAKQIDPVFLHWYISQKPAQAYFQRNAQGSNVQSISRDVLQVLKIPNVSLEEQRKISKLVLNIYRHQDALNQLIDNDQHMMDGIAQSLCVRPE